MPTEERQLRLSVKSIALIDAGVRVIAPEGAVYSTNPRKADATDGKSYIIKGPETEIVTAEVCAHLLADLVELKVPDFGIADVDGQLYFASQEIQVRNAESFIRRNRIENADILTQTIVFDIWLANRDRNIWNFVGQTPANTGKIGLFAIDFEKSAALCERTPLVSIPMIDPKLFWPRGDLGQLMRGAVRPQARIERIRSLTREQISHCVTVTAAHVPQFTWGDSTIEVLRRRSTAIESLCREVWQ